MRQLKKSKYAADLIGWSIAVLGVAFVAYILVLGWVRNW